ncbi:hypothetical protein PG985_007643 [Apiospora marii]|uniref:Uncharacterized protein n=1 Tax=Apiospora marii TaxID=335849 RepID=A0ABR1SN06_9PEZI
MYASLHPAVFPRRLPFPYVGLGLFDGASIESTDVLTHVDTGTASHQPFTVMWAERGLELFPSDVSASRKSIVSSGFRQPTTTDLSGGKTPGNGNNTFKPSDPSRTGLSPGVIAGIVIGVAVAIILITLIMRYVLYMKSKRVPNIGRAPELDGVRTATWKRWFRGAWRAELDSSGARTELDNSNMRAEADSTIVRAELDSGNVTKEQRAELKIANAGEERPGEASELPDTTPDAEQS